MTRLVLGIVVLAVLVTPASAKSYRRLSLPELVGQSDVIVVGTVTKAGPDYQVKVTETLAGTAGEEVSFPKNRDSRYKVDDNRIFFLVSRKGSLSLVNPHATEEPAFAKIVTRMWEMKTDPKRFIDDPTQARTPDFLEILGYAFADRDMVGGLTKADAVEHLRQSLGSRDKQAVLQAIAGLQRTGGKHAAAAAIPLIRHPNEKVQLAAVDLLGWASERKAVEPLCTALDEAEKGGEFAQAVARALGSIRDPAATPSLVRAVKKGIDGWSGWALGTVGDETCFEILLDRAEKHGSSDAVVGLDVLIRRSNKKYEPWMRGSDWNAEKWSEWWKANKSDFKVIKTAEEAFGPYK
jgi:hypothetical protein